MHNLKIYTQGKSMPIPTHDEIRAPALRLLNEKGILKLKEFELSKIYQRS